MQTVSSFLSYNETIKLGQGTYSYVYQGLLKYIDGSSKAVAVKRIQNIEPEASFIQREKEVMKRAGDHKNILRYLLIEQDEDFL